MQIVWTAAALRDLAAIREYISVNNPCCCRATIAADLDCGKSGVVFPTIGRTGRLAGTRELVISRTPYIVPYRIRGDRIEIARVLHARQRRPDRV
jgi:toxin ParE1/3/4